MFDVVSFPQPLLSSGTLINPASSPFGVSSSPRPYSLHPRRSPDGIWMHRSIFQTVRFTKGKPKTDVKVNCKSCAQIAAQLFVGWFGGFKGQIHKSINHRMPVDYFHAGLDFISDCRG